VRALKRIDLPPEAGDGGDAAGWAVQLAPGGEWLAVSRRQLVAVRDALARP
jgi:two-component system response regulator AlgR